jgi:hypothetical protein
VTPMMRRNILNLDVIGGGNIETRVESSSETRGKGKVSASPCSIASRAQGRSAEMEKGARGGVAPAWNEVRLICST